MIYYDYEEVLLKVDQLFCWERYVKAKRLLEEVLQEEPAYGPAHFKLGWMYWGRLDDFEKAEQHFMLALKFSPEYPLTYYSYSLLLNEVNDHVKLVKVAEQALRVKGVNKFFVYNEFGKSYEMNQQLEVALRQYETALNFALIVCDVDQAKTNIHRVKDKMFETSIKNNYHTEVRS